MPVPQRHEHMTSPPCQAVRAGASKKRGLRAIDCWTISWREAARARIVSSGTDRLAPRFSVRVTTVWSRSWLASRCISNGPKGVPPGSIIRRCLKPRPLRKLSCQRRSTTSARLSRSRLPRLIASSVLRATGFIGTQSLRRRGADRNCSTAEGPSAQLSEADDRLVREDTLWEVLALLHVAGRPTPETLRPSPPTAGPFGLGAVKFSGSTRSRPRPGTFASWLTAWVR